MSVYETLYAAAKESIVAEETSVSTYEKIITAAIDSVKVDDFKISLKDIEKMVKVEFDLSSMPNPWRSAKSVVLTACALGLSLTDDNGKPLGKTYLQQKIKEEKKKEPLTTEEYVSKIRRMIAFPPSLYSSDFIRAEIKTFLC